MIVRMYGKKFSRDNSMTRDEFSAENRNQLESFYADEHLEWRDIDDYANFETAQCELFIEKRSEQLMRECYNFFVSWYLV